MLFDQMSKVFWSCVHGGNVLHAIIVPDNDQPILTAMLVTLSTPSHLELVSLIISLPRLDDGANLYTFIRYLPGLSIHFHMLFTRTIYTQS